MGYKPMNATFERKLARLLRPLAFKSEIFRLECFYLKKLKWQGHVIKQFFKTLFGPGVECFQARINFQPIFKTIEATVTKLIDFC